jgi:ribosomal protein S18 acetylase RimI-like enzyme
MRRPAKRTHRVTAGRKTVRRAVPGDEPVLRALRLEAMTEAPEAFASTYERELARTADDWRRWLSPGVTLLLEEAGQPLGLVAGMHDDADPGVAYLMAMWVHPALRGCGAADALVAAHLGWATETGAQLVRLDVMAANVRARRLYERHGFHLTGHETVLETDGRVELRMERPVGRGASRRPSGARESPSPEART